MNKDEFQALDMENRIAYINKRLSTGDDYEAILADIGLEKKQAGYAGFIKVGNEVRQKPGHGDNGFAW
jgi:hypothetical protein